MGTALYPLVAVVNHSCRPSAVLTFGRCFVASLRCVSALKPGDEVTIAYADCCAPAAERRAALAASHGFVCRCEACAAAFARGGSEHDRALGGECCSACGAATPARPTGGGSDTASDACEACGRALPPRSQNDARRAEVAALLAAAAAAQRGGDAAVRAARCGAALRAAEAARLSRADALRTRALEATASCRIDGGDWLGALACLKGATEGLEAAFGCGGDGGVGDESGGGGSPTVHPLIGLHWATMGRLAGAAGDAAAAACAWEVAARVLRLTHGVGAPVARDADQSAREMAAEVAHHAAARRLE